MVVTKQIDFSPSFLKSWANISDNVVESDVNVTISTQVYRYLNVFL